MRVIITGATGMVGEGVLHVALDHPAVDHVLVITRRPTDIRHPKLEEVLHADFLDFSVLKKRLTGYDACFFCLGISSIGMKEKDYFRTTYKITIALATILREVSPQATFCYVSGSGTDTTEKGRIMWARVKGKTENDLLALFDKAYMYRPGYIHPIKGMKHTLSFYKWITPFYPLMQRIMPRSLCTLEDLGLSMISVARRGYEKRILNPEDIVRSAVPERNEKARATI